MQQPIAYRVRAGFVFTDTQGARARTYAAGEHVLLPSAVGDSAHQLQRIEPAVATPPAVREPRRATRAREASR